jgi:acyl carrier protein
MGTLMQSTDHNLIGVLKDAFYDVTLKQYDELDADTRISELGLDSVAMMELIGVLEENLSIRIQDEEVATLNTVGDLLALIKNRLPEQQPITNFQPKISPSTTENESMDLDSKQFDISSFPEVLKSGSPIFPGWACKTHTSRFMMERLKIGRASMAWRW